MSWAAVVTRGQDAHQSTCCFHANSRTTIVSCRISTKKEKDRHRRGRAPATITTAPYSMFSPRCLKGPLCSQCSETKEEDMPGRDRGSKRGTGGVGGGCLDICQRCTSARQLGAADTQDPAGSTDAATRPCCCLPRAHPHLSGDTQPTQPLTWDRKG